MYFLFKIHGKYTIIRLASIFLKMYIFPIRIKRKVYDNQVTINNLLEEHIFNAKYMKNVQ